MATNQGKNKADGANKQNKKKNKQQKQEQTKPTDVEPKVEEKEEEEQSTPVVETPAPVAAPVVETPAPVATPVVETPAPVAAPVVETPAPVATPVIETPAVQESVKEAEKVEEPVTNNEVKDQAAEVTNTGAPDDELKQTTEQTQTEPKLNRNEKKVQKAMQKLGLKTVPKITRVTIKRSKDVTFVISNPEVLKSPNSDTYVVIGDVRVEDLSSFAKKEAAQKFRTEIPKSEPKVTIPTSTQVPAELVEEDEDEDEDEDDLDDTGLNPDDISIVMTQGNVSKAAAIAALRKSKGDVVNAIMSL